MAWHKGYGIDDQGRRTIVITEEKPPLTDVDRFMLMMKRGMGILIAVLCALLAIFGVIYYVGGAVVTFITAHRWIAVLALICMASFIAYKARHRFHDGKRLHDSTDATEQ